MAVDSFNRYSNEAETANEDSYDDFKLKKPMVYTKIYQRCMG